MILSNHTVQSVFECSAGPFFIDFPVGGGGHFLKRDLSIR
jgi:hypothetical protein